MFWESCIKKSADSDFPLSADQWHVFPVFCRCFSINALKTVLLKTFEEFDGVRCRAVPSQLYLRFLYMAMERGIEIAVSTADSRGMPS